MRRLLGFGIALLLATAGTLWAQAAERVPKLTADDYMQIQQLYSKYYQTYDAGDAEGWASVFTADGTFNTTSGADALRRQIENTTAKGTPLRHWQSNLLLTPVPGGVQGKVYVIQFDIRAKPITPASFSRYDDLLVKTSEGWRFKEKMRSSDTTLGRGGNPAGSAGPNSAGGATREQP